MKGKITMPTNKKQLFRMVKIVADLRKNSYPNVNTWVKMFEALDRDENLNVACGRRTVMRDIDYLRKDFNAPIAYSSEHNGYYLTNPYWEFQVPFFDNEMIMSSMLGAQLAGEILPSPVKEQIRDAVDNQISANNSELLDQTFIETLLIASGIKTTTSPEVFGTVFQAWRERRTLMLTYQKGSTGEVTQRKFEPHIVAYHKGNWYTKGVDLCDGKVITLAIFRIKKAELLRVTFEIRRDILQETKRNGLFNYPKIENIKVKCSADIAYYLYEQRKAKKLTIEPQCEGSLIVTLPPSPEQEAIRWILGEGGNVEVLEPLDLRKKIHDLAVKTADANK
jgi:predicted DNA-binding transcriptional regulator YafY